VYIPGHRSFLLANTIAGQGCLTYRPVSEKEMQRFQIAIFSKANILL
jgi:hypothetical protein